MPAANLALLDTSVYIENFRREDFAEIGKHLAFKVIFW